MLLLCNVRQQRFFFFVFLSVFLLMYSLCSRLFALLINTESMSYSFATNNITKELKQFEWRRRAVFYWWITLVTAGIWIDRGESTRIFIFQGVFIGYSCEILFQYVAADWSNQIDRWKSRTINTCRSTGRYSNCSKISSRSDFHPMGIFKP